MSNEHIFPYKWYLANGYPAENIQPNNLKVFGTFICGGGSTMGYKLAGYTHLGGVEIDEQVARVYKANHSPKYLYNEDIRTFNERQDLPNELYELDILDGSPPCSTFSMAGSREKAWGKEKHFREGQAKQTLDDLVFIYCETINKLRPKVAILENVKGIIQGNAKAYSIAIKSKLESYGYDVQIFLLNAASMGVPQKRERVFFIAKRKDLNMPKLVLEFNEKPINFSEISQIDIEFYEKEYRDIFDKMQEGDSLEKFLGYGFNTIKAFWNKPLHNVNSTQRKDSFKSAGILHSKQCRKLNDTEFKLAGTYPLDYNFLNYNSVNFPSYLIGMSVPPVMVAQIARQIHLQLFS